MYSLLSVLCVCVCVCGTLYIPFNDTCVKSGPAIFCLAIAVAMYGLHRKIGVII